MTSHLSPATLADQLFQHLAAGDRRAAADLFAPTVDFSIPGPGAPWIPAVDSPAGMLEFFTRLTDQLEGQQITIEKVLTDDAEAVVLGSLASTVRSTGRNIVSRFALRLGVEEGRINRYWLLEDSWAVAQALRPADG